MYPLVDGVLVAGTEREESERGNRREVGVRGEKEDVAGLKPKDASEAE